MILTITINPAIDKTIVVEKLNVNHVNRVLSSREDLGGKGINVSKVLTKLKVPTIACGFIGSKNYAKVSQFVDHEQLATDFVLVDATTRTNTKIVEVSSQSTTDINEPGFEVTHKEVNQLKTLIQSVAKEVDMIVFSGSLCQGMSLEQYGDLINAAKEHTQVVVDAEKLALEEALKHSPLLIKPNVAELEGYLQVFLRNENEMIQAALDVLRTSGTKMMLLSHGEYGSYFISEKIVLKAEALKVDVKSTVGAGDSMLAGFISEYVKSGDIRESLKVATACGALAVSQEGTQSFTLDEVLELKKHVKINDIVRRNV
ncbi:MAG: 1-phosphofructokinase [Erysipelothrix sp.]|jgi:1-phosphofructokinase|nr:1-phosphofructokinase [Erysipelothrix sp.]